MRRSFSVLLTCVLMVVAAACGDDDSASTGATTNASDDIGEDDIAAEDAAMQAAIADLADRLDVEPSEVVVVSADAVTWSDSSLGCPQSGRMYAQVLTDGIRIVLEVDGDAYQYHSAVDADPFLCEDPQEPMSIG